MTTVSGPDTIVAIATPPGRGGLGIVRISGPDSRFFAAIISGQEREWKSRQAYYCAIHDQDASVIDRGLMIFFPGPASYTGEDVLEVQAHGSRVVLERIVDHVISRGGRLARPGEFTERAFLNGKIDLVQAEAVADLIDAVSAHAARSAMRSLQGEFSRLINHLLNQVIQLRTLVEGSLDFPDEDVDFLAGTDIDQRLQSINSTVDSIVSRARQGALLKEGINVAIVGSPNVGKSTLLNQLAARDAAIVTEIAGTTRDLVEQDIVLEGVPVHLVDTAGLRDTTDTIEQEGIRRTRNAMANADILVYIQDYNGGSSFETAGLQEYADRKRIYVMNKIDLHGAEPAVEKHNGETAVFISAKTGAGMDLLTKVLAQNLGFHDLSENTFMARKRHIEALDRTGHFVNRAITAHHDKGQADILAEELRQAQEALSEITGEFVADDLLGNIFSSFCIGK